VNTADVAGAFGAISRNLILDSGQVKPEMIVNIDAASIIILVIPISWLISRLNKVAAMIVGMIIALVGFVGSGATNLGWFCCLMIFTFAIGEMICSPTFSAYVGLIAPKDKKALYMGYSNIPFAIGWFVGNIISNYMYASLGSKLKLARLYMVEHLRMEKDIVDRLKDADVMQTLATALDRTAREATQLLWNTYHPYVVWYYLGIIGLVGTIGMIIFYFTTRHRPPVQAPNLATA
jgi:MFS family permease